MLVILTFFDVFNCVHPTRKWVIQMQYNYSMLRVFLYCLLSHEVEFIKYK